MSPDLHDLVAPPPPPDFRERLYERAEEWHRRRALRWRVAAIAATAVAVAAIGAAGVFAFGTHRTTVALGNTLDQTVSCAVPVRAGVPVLNLSTAPLGTQFFRGKRIPHPAVAFLESESINAPPPSILYFHITNQARNIGFVAPPACTKAPTMSLTRAGLPRYDTVHAPSDGQSNDISLRCFTGTTVTIRVHATLSHNVPTAATILVRTGKKQRPMLYVDWTPKTISAYATGDCFG